MKLHKLVDEASELWMQATHLRGLIALLCDHEDISGDAASAIYGLRTLADQLSDRAEKLHDHIDEMHQENRAAQQADEIGPVFLPGNQKVGNLQRELIGVLRDVTTEAEDAAFTGRTLLNAIDKAQAAVPTHQEQPEAMTDAADEKPEPVTTEEYRLLGDIRSYIGDALTLINLRRAECKGDVAA